MCGWVVGCVVVHVVVVNVCGCGWKCGCVHGCGECVVDGLVGNVVACMLW